MTHTPGPWHVEGLPHNGYPYGISAPNGDNHKKGAVGTRVLRWGAFMLPSSEEALANARLIAAAPDLLEALECAVGTGVLEHGGMADMCRAAITKARGETA